MVRVVHLSQDDYIALGSDLGDGIGYNDETLESGGKTPRRLRKKQQSTKVPEADTLDGIGEECDADSNEN